MKAGQELGVVPKILRQKLESNIATQRWLPSLIDNGHAAPAQFLHNLIMANGTAHHTGHAIILACRSLLLARSAAMILSVTVDNRSALRRFGWFRPRTVWAIGTPRSWVIEEPLRGLRADTLLRITIHDDNRPIIFARPPRRALQ
jgi:hypothetical protein